MLDKNKTNHNKELSARIMAVQAYYQNLQNKKPIAEVVAEYLNRGLIIETEEGEEEIVKPQGALFKRILLSLDSRLGDIGEILAANVNKKEAPVIIVEKDDNEEEQENEANDEVKPPPPEKEIEPLLKAILLCGVAELLSHQDIDKALIINDYLDVTHSFYEKQQVSFVNGVLDKVATLIR